MKSNPKNIRKGHWVTGPQFVNPGNAYKVVSVKDGMASVLYNKQVWASNYRCEFFDVKRLKRLKFKQAGYNFDTK